MLGDKMVKYWDFNIFRRIALKMKYGYSPVVLITGIPNTGKTALGGLISEVLTIRVQSWLNGNIPKITQELSPKEYSLLRRKYRWNPERNCFFDMNELSHKLLDAKKESILIAEAGYELSFDEWMNKFNKFFDRVITTQRVMGNCYILNIPVAKDLARRQRRKIDYQFDCKYWGYAKIWEIKIKTREMVGNEFNRIFRGAIRSYPLPSCWKKLQMRDEENKDRIRKELIEGMQMEYVDIGSERIKRRMKCNNCGYNWTPTVQNPKRCPDCGIRLKLKKGRLENVEVTGGEVSKPKETNQSD